MWVRAVEEFDCPTHKLAKGKIAEVDERYAAPGIEAGKLVASSLEDYQETLIEKRTAPARRKAEPKREVKSDG